MVIEVQAQSRLEFQKHNQGSGSKKASHDEGLTLVERIDLVLSGVDLFQSLLGLFVEIFLLDGVVVLQPGLLGHRRVPVPVFGHFFRTNVSEIRTHESNSRP